MARLSKSSGARGASEEQVQRAILDYLRVALPRGSIVRVIPGGNRSRTTAVGYIAGTADIVALIHMPGIGHRPFFLEVKRAKGGKVSQAQLDEQDYCWSRGVPYEIVASVVHAHAALLKHGVPLRARPA